MVAEDAVRQPGAQAHTAVIVVAGVGDDAPGQASKRAADGLVGQAGYVWGAESTESYNVKDRDVQQVKRITVYGPGGESVDVYEFWWADLSRFPAALRSFAVALLGLFLQFPSVARAALRRGATLDTPLRESAESVSHNASGLLGLIEWIVAVPILLLNVIQFALVAGIVLGLAVLSHLRGTIPHAAWSGLTSVALAVFLGGMALLGWRWLRQYELVYGRYWARFVGVVLTVGVAGVAVWRGAYHKEPTPGLADALLVSVAYPFRVLWMLLGALVVVFLLLLAFHMLKRNIDARSGRTAMLGLAIGPFGYAISVAAVTAALGAVGQKFSSASDWHGTQPWCLNGPAGWSPSNCTGAAGQTAWGWGQDLFANALAPLVIIGLIALLLLLCAAWPLARLLWNRSPKHGSRGRRAASAQGLTSVIDSRTATIAVPVALLLSAGALLVAWGGDGLLGDHLAGKPLEVSRYVAAALGLLVSLAFAASRALGLTAKRIEHNTGTANETVRAILDKAYDVAIWLREPRHLWRHHERGDTRVIVRRQQILARGAALLAHVNRDTPPDPPRYCRNVFFAHSQGTVISTALLQTAELRVPSEVALITFGSPLRRLDARRLPGLYAWVENLPNGAKAALPNVTVEWASFAATQDPIGGPIFHQPTDEQWDQLAPWAENPDGLPLEEGLIDGAHSAYWDSPVVLDKLKQLIRLANPAPNG